MLTRRRFVLAGSSLIALPALAAPPPDPNDRLVLVSRAQAEKMRAAAAGDPASAILRQAADAALKDGPWSVTFHRPGFIKAEPNDYYSEGPYWWPDPKNPGGPYIRKDGQRNPDRYMDNRRDLGNVCSAAISLGTAAWLFGEKRYADHASEILSVWFADPKTRMNPNLEFGQAVRGINTGRGTGIIDTVSLIHAAQGIALLDAAGMLDAKLAASLRRWFADYLAWMTTSQKGLDEKKSGNNHATWWTAQAAAYATLAGDESAKRMAWDHYRNYLVPTEIQPDGSCPREEARTQSLSYSAMNLDAFSVLCRIAAVNGEDLWHYHTDKAIGVDRAFQYLMPYLSHPDRWTKEQITKFTPGGTIFPGLAGIGLKSADLLGAWHALPHSRDPWIQFVDLAVRTAPQP